MSTAAPVKEGDILAGKYRIERVLGVGGMGIVVAAHHVQLEQHVALKFLLPEALTNPDIVARFAREARSAAKIQSEHVARVIDVGTLENGSPFMVMEYLDGSDLAQVLYEHGVIPVAEACDFIMQACEAIAEAHAAGIVHRDLKPANLFLAKRTNGREIVKVLDFGISKVTEKGASVNEDLSLTKASTLVGSPLYMSPEQMASAKNVDARSDIWALGVILYELVSGFTPFTADSVTEMIAAVLQTKPRALNEVREDVPAELSAAIMRCLEKDPGRRFQSANELAAALWPFVPEKSAASMRRAATYVANSPTLISPLADIPSPANFTPHNLAADLPISSMRTMPAPPLGSSSPSHIISPVSSTAASPVLASAASVRSENVASSGVVSPQPMTVTDPTWGGTNGGKPNASPPRRTMAIGAMLGMFATIGVIAFAAAFSMRSKEPGAAVSPPQIASSPIPSSQIPSPMPGVAATSASAAGTPSSGVLTPAANAEPTAIASATPIVSASAVSAAHPPARTGRPAKPVASVSPSPAPAPAPAKADPKLEIRMTR